MTWNKKERRTDKRVKIKPLYRLKARVKSLANNKTQYFKVNDLSLGGLKLLEQETSGFDLSTGDSLEILIFQKNESVKVIAEVLEDVSGDADEIGIRAKIIGIDQEGRAVLASFLEKLSKERV